MGTNVPGGQGLQSGSAAESRLRKHADATMARVATVSENAAIKMSAKLRAQYEAFDRAIESIATAAEHENKGVALAQVEAALDEMRASVALREKGK